MDTFPNLANFEAFVGEKSKYLNIQEIGLMETYNQGGFTYKGMCNTGMYFTTGAIAKKIVNKAYEYLNKAELHPEFGFELSDFGIDSIVLWAAIYALQLEVILCDPLLNYIVPAENEILRFLPIGKSSDVQEVMDSTSFFPFDAHITVTLLHFSRGSDLIFATTRAITETSTTSTNSSIDESASVDVASISSHSSSSLEPLAPQAPSSNSSSLHTNIEIHVDRDKDIHINTSHILAHYQCALSLTIIRKEPPLLVETYFRKLVSREDFISICHKFYEATHYKI